MQELNGADILDGIKRLRPDTAIVMMTGSKAPTDRAGKRRFAGTLGLLKKPFYPADVDAVIERYLGLRGPR